MSCIIIKHWQHALHSLSNKQRLSHPRELTVKWRHKTRAYCAELQERDISRIFLIILFSIYSKQTFPCKMLSFQATTKWQETPILSAPFLKNVERRHFGEHGSKYLAILLD